LCVEASDLEGRLATEGAGRGRPDVRRFRGTATEGEDSHAEDVILGPILQVRVPRTSLGTLSSEEIIVTVISTILRLTKFRGGQPGEKRPFFKSQHSAKKGSTKKNYPWADTWPVAKFSTNVARQVGSKRKERADRSEQREDTMKGRPSVSARRRWQSSLQTTSAINTLQIRFATSHEQDRAMDAGGPALGEGRGEKRGIELSKDHRPSSKRRRTFHLGTARDGIFLKKEKRKKKKGI